MNYNENFLELKNYDYVPVRVYLVKPYRVLIFLGRETPQRIRNILDNISAKKILNNKNELEHYFGPDWFYLLALDDLFDIDNINKLKQDTQPRNINKKSAITFYNRMLSSTLTELTPIKGLSKDFSSMSLDTIDIENKNKIIKRVLNPSETDLKEVKNNLQKVSKTKEPVIKKQKKEIKNDDEFGALETFDTTEEQMEENDLLVAYIFDNIFEDDNFNTVKKKIFLYSQIEPDFQHLVFEETENSYVSLTHKWIKTSGRMYRTDIFDLLKQNDLNNIIDEKFINNFKTNEIFLEEYSTNIIADIKNFNFDIWVFDFQEIIKNFNRNKITEMLSNKYDTQKLYLSLGKKYYPTMKQDQFMAILNGKYIPMNKKSLELEYDKEYPYLKMITEMKNYKQYLKNLKLLQLVIHINFNSYDERFLELRSIFDNFETTEDIPFIKYRDFSGNITIKKFTKNILNHITINELKERWIEGEHPQGIHFRIRQSLNKKDEDYNRFAIVNLLPDGKVILKCYWKRANNASFMNLLPCLEPLNSLIDRINQINYDITQKTKRVKKVEILEKGKSHYKLSNNTEIAFFNVDFNYKSNKDLLDYNELDHIFASLYPFVNVILNKETKTYQGTYLRYKRVSDYELVIDKYIKFLKDNYDFNDTKILVALINIFNKTKEEAIKIVEEYNRKNGQTTIIENDDEIIYDPELIKSIRKNTKQPGVDIEIQDSENDNIIKIEGVKSLWSFNRIINFLSRVIYIYEHLKDFTNTDNVFAERYKHIAKSFTKVKMSKKKEIKENSKVKTLREYDPELFNIDPNYQGKKYKLYSKLCQGDRKQPILLSDEEASKLNKKDYTYLLEFPNKTNPDKMNKLMCDDKVYKYPGFIQGSKHPKGHCLPCCYSSPVSEPSRISKYNTFQKCLGKDTESDIGNDNVSNPKYIKQAGKELKLNGLGKLPLILDVFLNENNTLVENKNNIAENGTKYYIRFGSLQNQYSILNAINYCYKSTHEGYILLKNIINILKKNPDLFQQLESGKIKLYFQTLDNFIEYLNAILNGNDIKELKKKIMIENIDIPVEKIDDFIKDKLDEKILWYIFKLIEPQYNIFILEQEQDMKINLICPEVDIFEDFYNTELESIVLIKSQFSIYPIFEMNIINNKLKLNKTFRDNDFIIEKMKILYKEKCFNTEKSKLKFEKITNYIENPNSYIIEKIVNILLKYKIIEGKLSGQLLNNIGKCIGLIVNIKGINGKNINQNIFNDLGLKIKSLKLGNIKLSGNTNVIIPCYKSNIRPNLLIFKENIVDLDNQLLANELLDTIGLGGYQPLSIIKYKNEYLYLKINSGRRIKLGGKINPKKIPIEILEYDENDVEKTIKQKKKEMDERIKVVKELEYNEELLNLLRYELSKYLNKEIDTEIRKKIMNIIRKDSKLRTNLRDLDSINIDEKREIVEIVKKEDDINYINELLKDLKLSPDQENKRKIIKIIENTDNYNKKYSEILTILTKISKLIVKTGNGIPNLAEYSKPNIRHMCGIYTKKNECENNFNCIYSNKGCSLYIPSNQLDNMLQNITHELLRNEYRRTELLDERIDFIIDKKKYNTNPREILITDENIDINKLLELIKGE